jgi:hypothetical protein
LPIFKGLIPTFVATCGKNHVKVPAQALPKRMGGCYWRVNNWRKEIMFMDHKQDEIFQNPTETLTVDLSQGVALDKLTPLDTIVVQTRNSNYRIFLLDPQTGHALIEGGAFAQPVDALVNGSVVNSTFKTGWIGTGMRLEFWTEGKLTSTSPVQSYQVETHIPVELMALIN